MLVSMWTHPSFKKNKEVVFLFEEKTAIVFFRM